MLLTPVAIAAGRRLAERLFNGQAGLQLDYSNIPSVVFSHPPVGGGHKVHTVSAHPLSRKRVCPPPPPRNQMGRGVHTSPCVRGWGESQFRRLEKKHSVYSVVETIKEVGLGCQGLKGLCHEMNMFSKAFKHSICTFYMNAFFGFIVENNKIFCRVFHTAKASRN